MSRHRNAHTVLARLPLLVALVALVALAVAAGAGAAPAVAAVDETEADEPAPLRYDLTLTVDDPAVPLVEARAHLAGLDGPVSLAFPERFAYAVVEPRLVAQPAATDADGRALVVERLDTWRFRLDPGAADEAVLTWSVRLDHRDQPGVAGRDAYEHPYLADDHGMLVTGAVVLAPDDHPLEATARFALPDGWPVYAPWAEAAPGVFAPDHHGLIEDVVAIGHWRVVEGEVDAMRYTVAFAPGQDALAELVLPRLPPIVEAEVELFGGAPEPAYLFVFGRPDQPSGYGGSPKAASMTLFVSPDLPLDFAAGGVTHLIAHEFHHTWMKARCAPHDELRFVMEGFSDWYAYVVPWRLGMVDDAAFVSSLEEKLDEARGALAAYGGSLLDAGGPSFFEGGDAYRACYAGGLAMALWTDLALRDAGDTAGLDELLRRFYEDPRWRDGTRPELEHWLALLEDALGPDAASVQADALRRHGGPDWPALFLYVDVDLDDGPTGGGAATLPPELSERITR